METVNPTNGQQGETRPSTEMTDHAPRSWLAQPPAVLLLLFLITILIYSNSFSSPFHFDDHRYITDNPLIKNLSHFLHFFGFRYVGVLTFALNYHFDQLHLFGYHLVNLLIHLTNGGLVYLLVRILYHTPRVMTVSIPSAPPAASPAVSWIALATAALFLVHPVQTEAVTYIVQRLASLATLFYLLTVICYLRWRLSTPANRRRWVWYGAALLTTVLAMTTKEITFTLPFMLLLVEVVFFGLPSHRGWLSLLPFLLTLPIIPLSRPGALGEGEAGFASATTTISRLEYFLTQFRVIVTYLRLLVLPIHQNLDYDYPVYHSLFQFPVFVSFLGLLGLGGGALWLLLRSGPVFSTRAARSLIRGERPDSPRPPQGHTPFSSSASRLAAFGVLWFFLTLSIESSIIPIADVIYEHRLYLPGVGLFLAASAVLLDHSASRRLWGAVVIVIAVAVFSVATYQRNNVWQSEITLWQDVVSKSPHKARGHNNLGRAYHTIGRDHDAIHEYQAAISLDPALADAYNNLGLAYADQGRPEDALQEYQHAITLQPDYPEPYYNQGLVYYSQSKLEDAHAAFQEAVRLKPEYAEAHYYLGVIYGTLGRLPEAIREYRATLALNSQSAEVHNNLGRVYQQAGLVKEAIGEFHAAITLKPDDAEAHNRLGIIYKHMGQYDQAVQEFQSALSVKPDVAAIHNNLGNVYQLAGRLDDALREYQRATTLDPDYPAPYYNTGLVYYSQGKLHDALAAFQEAVKLNPRNADARNNLGELYKELGRSEEAIRQFQTALTLKPDMAEAYYNLGESYQQAGRIPQAAHAFERALQLRPDDERVRRALTALGR